MNWKNVIYSSVGATVGTVGVSSFLNGFDVYLLLAGRYRTGTLRKSTAE